ncbi:DoxX-like family protein [Roseateles sp. BYS87W]|uniref:DoxX-like family protein n=1 Tax=Pelomonas baiyunensis TaxID=3299026 RepID=A0ABW7GUZ5_9BURK
MSPVGMLRGSLVLLWWGTVVASLHDGGAAGAAWLQRAAGCTAGVAQAGVWMGCAWDAVVGLLLLLRPTVGTTRLAAAGVMGLTAMATALAPGLWLDPFAPLLKNLPVLAALAALASQPATPVR